jgi:hypothetical protein
VTAGGQGPSSVLAGILRSNSCLGIGLFFFIGAVYFGTNPGRIDIIDGQFRYEVSRNLVRIGRPVITDPFLLGGNVPGLNGARYSYYNAAPSVAGMPWVWLGRIAGDPAGERQRFLFAWTSGLLGSLACVVLFLFYRQLDISASAAIGWTLAHAFGTLLWPLAASTFDQGQHALFVLLAVFLGWQSAKSDSLLLAAAGGLTAGVLLNYQESYAVILPMLALSTLAQPRGDRPQRRRSGVLRYGVFLGACLIGLQAWLLYNEVRFGDMFFTGRSVPLTRKDLPFFGNPATGLLSLLVSPGKSVFLYSPPLLLGVVGLRHLWRRERCLVVVIVSASVVHLAFISSLSFFGSDWAWGPRYLVALLPLWALAAPLATREISRWLVIVLLALGIFIQTCAISIDHQRFFLERALPDYFWADDPWSYFKHSALLARPAEMLASIREGVPPTARHFAPGPYPGLVTYTTWSNRPRDLSPTWVREYKVFYLPRPWPLWMPYLDPSLLPIATGVWTVGVAVLGLLGAGLIYAGVCAHANPRVEVVGIGEKT